MVHAYQQRRNGNVTETGIEESGLTAYAIIEPAVNPNKINNVMVITDFDKSEAENQIPTGNIGEDTTEETTENTTESTTNTEENSSSDEQDPTEATKDTSESGGE